MFVLVAPHVKKVDPQTPIVETGAIYITVMWPDDRCVDVDTWFRTPDNLVVGYSQKDGLIANLLRDDLGCSGDISGRNFEIVQTHGAPPGEYVVNVHYFMWDGKAVPVHVIGQIRIKETDTLKTIFDENVVLEHAKDEITVIRFTLDDRGRVVFTTKLPAKIRPNGGSVNSQ